MRNIKNKPSEQNSEQTRWRVSDRSVAILPKTLISRNWIPMAKDFSSDATDLPAKTRWRVTNGVEPGRFWRPLLARHSDLPQQHHVERVVAETGDQRRRRDDGHHRDQQVRAAVAARHRSGFGPAARHAAALRVELHGRGGEGGRGCAG